MDLKNKQQINKLNSIIGEYESKLDGRVDQLLREVIANISRFSIIQRSAQTQ